MNTRGVQEGAARRSRGVHEVVTRGSQWQGEDGDPKEYKGNAIRKMPPISPQDGPTGAQDGPRAAQEGAETVQGVHQDGPRGLQDGPNP